MSSSDAKFQQLKKRINALSSKVEDVASVYSYIDHEYENLSKEGAEVAEAIKHDPTADHSGAINQFHQQRQNFAETVHEIFKNK